MRRQAAKAVLRARVRPWVISSRRIFSGKRLNAAVSIFGRACRPVNLVVPDFAMRNRSWKLAFCLPLAFAYVPALRPSRQGGAGDRIDARNRAFDRRGAGALGRQGGDRKSTRLNSSHSQI